MRPLLLTVALVGVALFLVGLQLNLPWLCLLSKPLPMLGEAASRSYQRYLTSFDHPIPEYFETTVPNSSNGGNSR